MLDGSYDLSLAGYLLAIFSYGIFALVFAHRSWRTNRELSGASLVFLLALVASAAWGLAGVAAVLGGRAWIDDVLVPLADVLRYAGWFGFIIVLLRPNGSASWRIGSSALMPAAAIGLLLAALAAIARAARWASAEELTHLQAYSALGLAICGLILVEQLLKNVRDDSRWNAKPVCLGLAAVFVFDLYVFSQAALFKQLDTDAFSIRAGVHSLAVPLLYLASKRHNDWLAKLQVSRQAVFHSATLLLTGAYLLLVSALGYYVRYTGGNWGRALQLALMVIALVGLVVVVLSGAMRAKLRVYISKNFFSYRYDYREEWLRFTAMLSSQASPQELGNSVIKGLCNLVESPGGAIWLRHANAPELHQSARLNSPTSLIRESLGSGFAAFLREKAWVFDLDEVRSDVGRFAQCEVPGWLLSEPRYWLLVPLLQAQELIGFVVLERPRTPLEVNWEVRDLLKTASTQASSYLAQMQSTEALLEARKFEAFNKMSAFVVHDLKNIVTQLSLMMKNARRLRDNPEFQEDMLSTVENSLEKMRQLMLQLREGERPHGLVHGVELLPIVQRLAKAAQGKGRSLELQIEGELSTRGHEERVERVIGHVVQNAFDATPPEGRVWLSLSKNGSYARVEVGDTGCGMSEDFIQQRLFKPFQTTKVAGMGIGAYESFQYLQEIGGKIEVTSELGVGTRINILLPLFFASQNSDLGLMGAK